MKHKNRTIYTPNEIIVYNDYAEIILYNKKCEEVARVIIDLDKVEVANKYKWSLNAQGYVITRQNNKIIRLHRLIMSAKDGQFVDHIDKNKLNCKVCNLRLATIQQNNRNSSVSKDNTSGITGVWFDKNTNKWCSEIMVDYKKIWLGRCTTKEEAIDRRLQSELKYFGEFSPNIRK